MAGFNDWFIGMLESGWQGLENFGTDILDMFGFGTTRRAQEHDKEMLEIENDYNTEREDIAWERTMEADNTKVQRSLEDMKSSGLNPYLVYGSGSTPSSAPTASSSSAGSGGRAGIQGNMNLIGQLSGLLNSVNNARALDYQMNRKSHNVTTQRMYDGVGNLISTLVKVVK